MFGDALRGLECWNIRILQPRSQLAVNATTARRMYWRRASIQDGQAFCTRNAASAWWRAVLKRFLRNNFVTFRRWSKRIAFLESVKFSTRVYVQIFNFRDGHVTTFRHHSGGLYLSNAWSQTLQTSKRHTFRVSVFQRYHWFGAKLFTVACSQDSRKLPKNAKMLFLL